MDGNIDKVREALDYARRFSDNIGIEYRCNAAISALSAIDPDAIRRAQRMKSLLQSISSWFACWGIATKDDLGQSVEEFDREIAAIISVKPAQDECPDCIGRGWIIETDRHDMPVQVQCEACLGRGYINTKLARDDGKPGAASFEEIIKEWILHSKYKDEYIQASIVMLRKMFNERAAEAKRRIEEDKE